MSRTFVIRPAAVVMAVVSMSVLMTGQERDRAKRRRQVQVEPGGHLSERGRLAGRKRTGHGRVAEIARLQRQARVIAAVLGRRARADVAPRQGAVAALRLRQHARRPGHARLGAAGHAAGDAADLRELRRAGVPTSSRRFSSRVADASSSVLAAEPRLKTYAFYLRDIAAPRAAHVERRRGEDPRRRRPARRSSARTSTASCPTPISRIRRSR